MAEKHKSLYVPRVNQLDACYLNEEIIQRIKQPFLDSLQALTQKYSYYYRLQPEVELLLDTIIWYCSMYRRRSATFGQQMLMMAYDKKSLSQSRLALHYCFTVLSRYLKNLDEKRFSFRIERFSNFIDMTENSLQILKIINLFRFLKSGYWPTLVDYILDFKYVPIEGTYNNRNIGSQYLMRELFWSTYAELITTLLPIINLIKMNRFFKSILHVNWRQRQKIDDSEHRYKKPIFSKESRCVYCDQRPYLPQYLNCGHLYCYYCLNSNILSDCQLQCIICNRLVSLE